MTRYDAAQTLCAEHTARAVTYESDTRAVAKADQRDVTPRGRSRREWPARSERTRGAPVVLAAPAGAAVPVRPSVRRTHRLVVTGELRHDSAAALEAAIDVLCASAIDELVLDLAGLTRIDATGVRVIAMRRALCKKRGVRIRVERVARSVRDAFLAAGRGELVSTADQLALIVEQPSREADRDTAVRIL